MILVFQRLEKILRPSVHIKSKVDRRRALTTIKLAVVYATFSMLTVSVYIMARGEKLFTHPVDIPVVISLVMSLCACLLAKTRWVRLAGWLMVSNHFLVSAYSLFHSGPEYWVVGLFFPVGLLLSGLVQRTKETGVVFAITAAVLMVFMLTRPETLLYSFYLTLNYLTVGGFILVFQANAFKHLAGRNHEKNLASQIIESTSDLIFLCDQSGNILRKNRAFTAMADDKRCLPLLGELEQLAHQSADSGLMKSQIVRSRCGYEKLRHFHVLSQPLVEDGEQKYVLTIARDITKIKEAEFEVQEQQQKAMSSARLAELGEFAGSIAHEIANPLQVILASSQTMQRVAMAGKLDADKALKDAKRVERTVKKIVSIVSGLRTFVRDGSEDEIVDTSVASIVDQVIEVSRHAIEMRGIEIRVSVEPDLKVECREVQFCQVLMNLIGNAIHEVAKLDEKWIRIGARQIGAVVEISVIDSGRGIPQEVADKIMSPFFTTKPAGEGTGLGLAISSSIIKAHRGTLIVNTVDGNTAFHIKVPRHQFRLPVAQAS